MSSDHPNDAEQTGACLNYAELAHFPTDFVLFDRQLNILTLSSGAKKLLAATGSRLEKDLLEMVQESFSAHKEIRNRQIMPSSFGKKGPLLNVSTVPVSCPNEVDECVLVIVEDSERAEKLEQRLRQLNRLASIGTLSASLAHEMKNALVPVRTFFELQKNGQDELTAIATQGLRRVESLVSQILKYGGPAKPAPTLIHLHEVLENSLRLIQFQLALKSITLERAFNAKPDALRGDGYQLEQAFGNVLLNALEAMKAGGRLCVATDLLAPDQESVTPRLRVRISDTGPGIAPENLARLFDTFFTTKANGTGLGLTITRRILQEHSASITVDSVTNKGTTFTILLQVTD